MPSFLDHEVSVVVLFRDDGQRYSGALPGRVAGVHCCVVDHLRWCYRGSISTSERTVVESDLEVLREDLLAVLAYCQRWFATQLGDGKSSFLVGTR